MQNAVPVGEGSMIAVLGLKTEEVKKFIENQKGICESLTTTHQDRLSSVEIKAL